MVKQDKRNTIANQREGRSCSIVGSKRLVIDGCVYQIHPSYDMYAASRDGKIIHIVKQVPNIGVQMRNSYMLHIGVKKYGSTNRKTYLVHRFVWECFHGMIPDGKVIDHINNNKEDNRLSNLQLMTQQENSKT